MIHSGRGELVQVPECSRVGIVLYPHGSGLNNDPLISELRRPLLRRHFVEFQRYSCDCVPIFHGFIRVAASCMQLTIDCVCFPSLCTTFENSGRCSAVR